jgi:hypothetical protein
MYLANVAMAKVVKAPTIVPPVMLNVVTAWDEAKQIISPSEGEPLRAKVNAKSEPLGLISKVTFPLVEALMVDPVVGVEYCTVGISRISNVDVAIF